MHTQYSQTWRQFNPTEFVLTEFNNNQEKESNSKKVPLEILACFALFILFAYSLSWFDQKINQRQEQNQIFDFNSSVQIQENGNLYHYFQYGYIGQNLVDNNKYKIEIENKLERIKQFENLI